MKASVIIPTYNKVHRLALVLESFKYQTEELKNFEVIVVNDGSDDETLDMLKSFNANYCLRYVTQSKGGRSHARNKGVSVCDNSLLIFCDDDCIVSRNYVSAHITEHKKRKGVIVHGRIYNLPYLKFFSNPTTGEVYENLKSNLKTEMSAIKKHLIQFDDIYSFDKIEKQKKMTMLEKNICQIFEKNISELKWLGCVGGNVSFDRMFFDGVGRFDEDLDAVWGCEDLELGYRSYKNGASFQYSVDACNYHMAHYRKTFEEEMNISFQKLQKKYDKEKDAGLLYLPLLLLGKVNTIEEYINVLTGVDR